MPENSDIGTIVGTLSTIDEDTNQEDMVYSIIENQYFNVIGRDIVSKLVFNYESDPKNYVISITSVGSHSITKDITINITDVNEPPTDITISNRGFPENSDIGTIIGTFAHNDPDNNDIITYTCSDTFNFEIDGNQLKSKRYLDYETQPYFLIDITATDSHGLSFQKQFNIFLTDTFDDFTIESNTITNTAVSQFVTEN